MIKVTAELLPKGFKSTGLRAELFTIEIRNDRTGTEEVGNYRYTFKTDNPGDFYREIGGHVKNFDRQDKAGALRLLYEVLKRIFKEE